MKIKTLAVALLATTALVGCQSQDDNDAAGDPNDNNIEQTSFDDGDGNATTNDRDNRQDFDMNKDDDGDNNNNNNNNNDNNKYDVSDKAADKITKQVKGIDSAYVVTTDNNAYVAADFDDNMDNNGTNNNGTNGTNGTNNNGTTGNNNAGNDDELSDDVKQKITDIVKSIDGDIDHVYVSTNPDFLDSVKDYADQADSGEPIKGLFDQMGDMIERVFPGNGK